MSRPSQRTLEQRLSDGVVVGAEGYVFELERRGYIKAGPYVPEVILDEPDALRQLHREFLRAGSDVMVALTYYAHREKLKDVGRDGELEELNRQAVRIANEIAAEGGALVAGNICNTWSYDPADPVVSGAVVRAQYEEQLGWAVEEGVDFVIAETNDHVGEALIGLEVCKELGLPAMVTFASVQPETTYDGYDYVEACRILAGNGATRGRAQLLQGPGDDAAAARADPRGGGHPGGGAAGALPDLAAARRRSSRWRRRTGSACSRSSSSRSSARASRWPTSPAGRATSASATSGSAAAEDRTTCGRWPRRWVATPRPAATRRRSSSTRSSGRPAAPASRSSWAAGPPARASPSAQAADVPAAIACRIVFGSMNRTSSRMTSNSLTSSMPRARK